MSDDAVRARNAGKDAMVARIAWQLSVGPGEAVRVRCVREPEGNIYVVQIRDDGRWTDTKKKGADPAALLRAVIDTPSVLALLTPSSPS